MRYLLSGIILILFILLLVYICTQERWSLFKESYSQKKHKTPELPPLNYYALKEPNYFFYDPILGRDPAMTAETVVNDNFSNFHPDLGAWNEDINHLFGPDNYLRYYPESIETVMK